MIEYEEDWILPLIFRWKGSVYYRALFFALPGAIVSAFLVNIDEHARGLRVDIGMMELGEGVVWSASTAILLAMVGFRTRQGYSRFWEGTGLLHQMKGEWFDTISNCVTFSISAKKKKPEAVNNFRHTIVRLMSLCHASALEEISGMDSELETIDTRGLDHGTLRHLKNCVEVHGFNKVEVLLHLIQSLITKSQDDQILCVPPPILSRVYQTCSRGYVNLLNTKKITDTKFPFPYVQLISFLLLLHTLLTPMVLASLLSSLVLTPLITFVALFGTHAINFIAIELENPFGEDDNDLPLAHFQAEMNSCLLMLLHYDTDIIAGTSPECIMDFDTLKQSMTLCAESEEAAEGGICHRIRCLIFGEKEPEPVGSLPPQGPRKISRRLSEVEGTNGLPGGTPQEGDAVIMMGSSEGQVSTSNTPRMSITPRRPVPPASIGQASAGAQDAAGAPAPPAPVAQEPVARTVYAGQENFTTVQSPSCTCRGACTCKAKIIPALPEPKLVRSQDLSPLLVESMDEFNQSLQSWTQMMEDQVKDLSQSFSALSRLSNAAPRHRDISLMVSRCEQPMAPEVSTMQN